MDRLWCFLPNKWTPLLVFVTLCFTHAKSQDCDFPQPVVFNILETDPSGSEMFNVSSYNRTIVYRYTTNLSWLTAFLNFSLDDTNMFYYMRLVEPLDLEEIYYNLSVTDISAFPFTLYCKTLTEKNQEYHIIVKAVSEWSPEFNSTSIQLSVKETLSISSVVINLTNWASDKDVNSMSREIAGYSVLPYTADPQVDGHMWLQMLIAYDGVVVIKAELDYEALPKDNKYILLGVQVSDQEGKTGTASLTVYVEDDDDLPPVFSYPACGSPCRVTYTVTVSSNVTGPVAGLKPGPIQAHDGDALNYSIEYHIVQGPENYEKLIIINSTTGHLSILQAFGRSSDKTMVLIIEAREVSLQALATRTTLLITVEDDTKEEAVAAARSSDNTTIIAVATSLAAIVLVAVVILIIMTVYFKKRYKKTVHPENTLTTNQVAGPDVLHGIHEHTSALLSKETRLPQRTDSEKTLGVREDEDVHVVSSRFAPHRQTSLMLTGKESGDITSADTRELKELHKSGQTLDNDQDEAAEYLVSVSDTNIDISSPLTLQVDTETHKRNSLERPTVPPRPSIKIVSGLKFQDESEVVDAVDKMNETSTPRSALSDTDQSAVCSSASSSPITNINDIFQQAPLRKKRPRKRAKTITGSEEHIYNGAKDTENIELDSGFYTDSTKKRIKRSSRVPVMIPDPNDTRYWITVGDDY